MKAGTLEIELITNVARLQREMADIRRAVGTGMSDVARNARVANDNLEAVSRSATRMGGSARLAGHQMQNLSFQINDMIVGLTSGQKPMTVFMQQGAQIGQIMAQSGVGVRGMISSVAGLAGQVVSKLNPAMLIAGTVAGGAFMAFRDFQKTVDDSGRLKDYAAGLGLTAEEQEKLTGVTVTFGDTLMGVWDVANEGLGITEKLSAAWDATMAFLKDVVSAFGTVALNVAGGVAGAFKGSYDAIRAVWGDLPAVLGDVTIGAANRVIAALNWLMERAVAGMNWLIDSANVLLEKAGMGSIDRLAAPQIGMIANQNAGAAARAGKTAADAFSKGFNETLTGLRQSVDGFFKDVGTAAEARARARLKAQADALIEKRSDGSKAAKAKEAKEELSLYEQTQANIAKLSAQMSKDIEASVAQMARQGLTIAEWGDKLAEEQWQRLQDQKRAHQENLDLLLDQLRVVEQMGGAFGKVAAIVSGIQTGDFSGITGKLGSFLNSLQGAVGQDGWKKVTGKLDQIFGGKDGDFAKTFGGILKDASFGYNATSLLLGSKKSSQSGALIGSGLGTAATAITGIPGLSQAFSVIGSLVGGLLKKTQWGRVDLTSAGASAGVGNDKASIGAAVQAGGAFFNQLRQIADAFGGGIGDFGSISIGQRHGDWRVNTGGGSLKIKKGAIDFNDDADAAIAYAIQVAIERGAITGIRASTQNLLRASSDLQEKLDKALQFEGVFTELKRRTDPTAFALEEMGKQFDRLRKIFDEAGASAAEYAQLEQLLAMQRADIETEKLNKQRALEVRLLEAQGKASEALALQRTIELSTTEDWLKNLQSQVYAAQDAAQAQAELAQQIEQAAAKFKGFASDLKSFRDSLGGNDTLAMTYRQAMTKLISTGALAIAGDETALGALSGVGKDFLAAAKNNASSAVQYQRDVALLTRYVDDAIATANYLSGNPGAASSGVAASAAAMGGTATGQPSMAQAMADLRKEIADMRAEQKALGESNAMSNAKTATILARVERAGGALAVVTDDDAPLHTVTP